MQKRKDKGITLISLILTVVIMLILTTVTVSVSTNRFALVKINNMYSDIELLKDKTELYYMDNNELPIIENKTQDVSKMNSDVLNVNDNQNYYIIDFDQLDLQGINYGFGYKEIKNNSTSDDIYIINETTHTIYYYAGFEYEGTVYYRRKTNEEQIEDNIPPSRPEINIISGTKNEENAYITEVELQITPGNDNWAGVKNTTYSLNKGIETSLPESRVIKLNTTGEYEVKVFTYDNNENRSENTITIKINLTQES